MKKLISGFLLGSLILGSISVTSFASSFNSKIESSNENVGIDSFIGNENNEFDQDNPSDESEENSIGYKEEIKTKQVVVNSTKDHKKELIRDTLCDIKNGHRHRFEHKNGIKVKKPFSKNEEWFVGRKCKKVLEKNTNIYKNKRKKFKQQWKSNTRSRGKNYRNYDFLIRDNGNGYVNIGINVKPGTGCSNNKRWVNGLKMSVEEAQDAIYNAAYSENLCVEKDEEALEQELKEEIDGTAENYERISNNLNKNK